MNATIVSRRERPGHSGRLRGLLAAPAAASAQVTVTIGANLQRAPNAAFDCTALPTIDAFGGRTFLPSTYVHGIFGGAPMTSCTYLAVAGLGGQGELTQAPGPGVVTQVAVRIGPTTGPMQVVVLRSIRSKITQSGGCCTLVAASQVFTPTPNTVTAVPVALPMNTSFSADEEVGEAVDYLGLSVLAAGVPIRFRTWARPATSRSGGAGVPPGLQPAAGHARRRCRGRRGRPAAGRDVRRLPGWRAVARAAQAGCRTAPHRRCRRSGWPAARSRTRLRARAAAVTLQRCGRRCSTIRRLTANATQAGVVRLRVPRAVRRARYRVIAEATDAAGNRASRTVRLRG